MLFASLSFGVIASKYATANGLVDYAEAAYGKTFGFYANWFSTVIYYPSFVAVLVWVSGLYTTILFDLAEGDPSNVQSTWIFVGIYFVGASSRCLYLLVREAMDSPRENFAPPCANTCHH